MTIRNDDPITESDRARHSSGNKFYDPMQYWRDGEGGKLNHLEYRVIVSWWDNDVRMGWTYSFPSKELAEAVSSVLEAMGTTVDKHREHYHYEVITRVEIVPEYRAWRLANAKRCL